MILRPILKSVVAYTISMNLDTLYEMLYTHHVNDVYNDFENVNLEEEVVIIKRMVSEYVMLRVNIMCTLSCAPPMCVPR